MSGIDIFGLKEGEKPSVSEPAPGPERARPRGIWLLLDAVFILCCAGLIASRVLFHMGNTVPQEPISRPAPRPEPAQAEEAKAPAPEPKKEEPKPEPPPPALIAPAKGPIGSPSVNAPSLPQRTAAAVQPGAAPSPRASSNASSVRPIEFTYVVPDAREVYLLGPFLVRSGGRKAMAKVASATWQTTVYLNAGAEYHYRFETVTESGRRSTTSRRTVEVR